MPEASAPPQLKPHLVESWWKTRRTRQPQILTGEVQQPPQAVEHSMLCFYHQAKVPKEIQSATLRKNLKVPVKFMRTQMWVGLKRQEKTERN